MGGHVSKQTVDVSTNLVTNASLNVAQNCLTYTQGDQVIDIYGSGNIFKGNTQRASLKVDSNCVAQIGQNGTFKEKLNNSIAQELKDQEIALTQWLDSSEDDQFTDIANKVTQNITFEDVQNCINTLQGTQLFIVRGNNDVIVDNLQEQTMTLASKCKMGGGQTFDVVNDVTNTVNQHSTYTSKNPFAFITDAIEATIKSAMAIAAVVFIAIVILVLVFEIGTKGHHQAAATPEVIVVPSSSAMTAPTAV
jgi:RNA-binding protein YhbY